MSIVIQNDFNDTPDRDFSFKDRLSELSSDDVIKIIKEAGIVGLGGAGFPPQQRFPLV
jgi:electron transport complex protein RnfC